MIGASVASVVVGSSVVVGGVVIRRVVTGGSGMAVVVVVVVVFGGGVRRGSVRVRLYERDAVGSDDSDQVDRVRGGTFDSVSVGDAKDTVGDSVGEFTDNVKELV